MNVHRIRLAGPWDVSVFEGSRGNGGHASSLPATVPVRVTMPAAWRDLPFLGENRLMFARRFQWPTVLDPGERVFVVLTGYGGAGEVLLNGERLGCLEATATRREFDVTDRLRSTNRLEIMLDFDPRQHSSPGGLHAPVLLEIRQEVDIPSGGP